MEYVFRLRLRTPLHIGKSGIGREGTLGYIPSDTLFGALVVTWAQLEDADPTGWLDGFRTGRPPFLLTSAFPFAGDVRLYPAPAFDPNLSRATRLELGKKLKKITYISEDILGRWLKGASLDDTVVEPTQTKGKVISNLIQGERVWVSAEERRQIAAAQGLPADEPHALRLWSEGVAPHVVVGRADNRANLYHTGRLYFAPACGLWFGVRGADDCWLKRIEHALALMADSGIGGLRSAGHGAFAWDRWPRDANQSEPSPGGYALLLSRTAPMQAQAAAILDPKASYRLVSVGGWCGNDGEEPRKRRRVRLLAEGSAVRWSAESLGQLVDVNPVGADGLAHGVYRYGYALAVGIADNALEVAT
jgi:CRISPR-associated protein Csm4